MQGSVYCSESCRLKDESSRAPAEHVHDEDPEASRAFLYESPLLKPQQGGGSPHTGMSPPLSPILMAQDPAVEQLPASTYRRWLVGSAPTQLHT